MVLHPPGTWSSVQAVYTSFLVVIAFRYWPVALCGFCLLLMVVILGIAFLHWLRNNRFVSRKAPWNALSQCLRWATPVVASLPIQGKDYQRHLPLCVHLGGSGGHNLLLPEHLWGLHRRGPAAHDGNSFCRPSPAIANQC